jgi:RNA polymerase sigma factor (TIGR02999 family)
MPTPPPDVTTLLARAGGGDLDAQRDLFHLVEGELRKRARARLRHEQPSPNLQTTLLVDEAFIHLVGNQRVSWQDRAHFYGCAARVMRQVLVDEARQRTAQKRGGEPPVSLGGVAEPVDPSRPDPLALLSLHDALEELGKQHPDLMEVVDLHHFGGWELKQIAEDILRLPYPKVKQKWHLAKAMLHRALSGGRG